MKIYVSLTTIPSKFKYLNLTIDSLLKQTYLPYQIIINIPKNYNFRFNNLSISEEEIDSFIKNYHNNNLIIFNLLDEDDGPGTKLTGLLKYSTLDKNSYIILIDDDVVYETSMIKGFVDNINKDKYEVSSYWIHYLQDVIVGQGVDGFCIKTELLDLFLQFFDIIKKYKILLYQDDIYISFFFHLLQKKIQRVIPPNNKCIYTLHHYTFIDGLICIQGEYSRKILNSENIVLLKKLQQEYFFSFIK